MKNGIQARKSQMFIGDTRNFFLVIVPKASHTANRRTNSIKKIVVIITSNQIPWQTLKASRSRATITQNIKKSTKEAQASATV